MLLYILGNLIGVLLISFTSTVNTDTIILSKLANPL